MKASLATRRERAMDNAENAATELICSAERYAAALDAIPDSKKWRRIDLLKSARAYASAIHRIYKIK